MGTIITLQLRSLHTHNFLPRVLVKNVCSHQGLEPLEFIGTGSGGSSWRTDLMFLISYRLIKKKEYEVPVIIGSSTDSHQFQT